jgi:hypothetical protein
MEKIYTTGLAYCICKTSETSTIMYVPVMLVHEEVPTRKNDKGKYQLMGCQTKKVFWRHLLFSKSEMKPSWFILNGMSNQEGFFRSLLFFLKV